MFDPRTLQGEGDTGAPAAGETESPGAEQYRGIFDPRNLEGQSGTEEEGSELKSPGADQYRSIFDPGNLQSQSGTDEPEGAAGSGDGAQ